MSKTYNGTIRPILPMTIRKLRENSSDSILYINDDHTVELPRSITVQSELPSPRKGNPGTTKTTVNVRFSVTLDQGAATERVVPVIAKLQTSFPVGTVEADRKTALNRLIAIIGDDDIDTLFMSGILPE